MSGDLATAQNALAGKREEFESLSQTRQRLEYQLVQARSQIQSAKQRQQYAVQQIEQIAEQTAGFERDKSEIELKLAEAAKSLESDVRGLSDADGGTGGAAGIDRTPAKGIRRRADATEFRCGADRKAEDGDPGFDEATGGDREPAGGDRDRAEECVGTGVSAGRPAGPGARQKLRGLRAASEELAGNLRELAETIARQQAELEEKRGSAAALGKQIEQVGERLGAAKEHRSGLVSRQKLLADMEAKREGVSEGVKSVLRRRDTDFPFIRGLVADVLRVDVEHAQVIEAALDGRDQYLVTDDSSRAAAACEELENLEGRVNVLCADRLNDSEDSYDWNRHPQGIRRAIDLVRFEPSDAAIARHLLGRTIVVNDLSAAREFLSRGAGRISVCDAERGSVGGGWGAAGWAADGGDGVALAPVGTGSAGTADRGSGRAHRAAGT